MISAVCGVERLGLVDVMRSGMLKEEHFEELRSARVPAYICFVPAGVGWVFLAVCTILSATIHLLISS